MFDITRGYEPQKRVKPWILGEKYMDTDPKKTQGIDPPNETGDFSPARKRGFYQQEWYSNGIIM